MMMPRIYPLECQFIDQQGDKNLRKCFSEACIFYPLFFECVLLQKYYCAYIDGFLKLGHMNFP